MNKREVAHVLRMMGRLLALKGEEAFKVRSYERAADSILEGDYDLSSMAEEGRLLEIPGIGRNLEPKVREMVLTGRSSYLERLAGEVPPGLLDLMNVPGIGPKTARLLHDHLGIEDLQGLREALALHRLRSLPGLGRKREELIARGLSEIEKYAGKVTLGVALPLLDAVISALSERGIWAEAAGEAARYEETVGGLDVVVADEGPSGPIELLRRSGLFAPRSVEELEEAWDDGLQAFSFHTSFGIPLRIHVAGPEEFRTRWTYVTGPGEYTRFLEDRAALLGLRLTRQGLRQGDRGDERLEFRDDAEFHEALDMDPVPPEVRHRGEMARLAAERSLPRLVEPADAKGDLHVHTSWSDGTASVEEMVRKALSLGYSYISITDHATEIKMLRSLSAERLKEQVNEIKDVASRYPDIRILSGVEVDIVRDGKLYLPDEVLRELDVVVASVHEDIGDSRGDLVRRLCEAAKNPNVDIIGHPTGRLIGRRAGLQSGLEDLFDVASKSSTVLEISASPERLDLGEHLVEKAYAAGCLLAVSSDAHSPEGMESLSLGVRASARRAALSASALVNTLRDPLLRLKRS
jgi:DNA polymerase (family 10)